MPDTYRTIRFYTSDGIHGRNRTLRRGLTLEEAQAHCLDPETCWHGKSSAARRITRRNGGRPWFDGYEKEKTRCR